MLVLMILLMSRWENTDAAAYADSDYDADPHADADAIGGKSIPILENKKFDAWSF